MQIGNSHYRPILELGKKDANQGWILAKIVGEVEKILG